MQSEFYINTNTARGNSMNKRHYHDSLEIYYMKSGECNYFIDSRAYHVANGDIVLIPEGVIHKTNYKDDLHTRILINCTEDYIPDVARDALHSRGYVYRNSAIRARAERIFSLLSEEYNRTDAYHDLSVRSLLCELLFLILRNKNEYVYEEDGASAVLSAVAFIKENYMLDVSLTDLARRISVSPEHLCRLFKEKTGFRFSEYLTIERMRAAEIMLRSSAKMTVAEIAIACGFNDSNYFSDRFKRIYGVAPTVWRKRLIDREKN